MIKDWFEKLRMKRYLKKHIVEMIPVNLLYIFYTTNNEPATTQILDLSYLETFGVASMEIKLNPQDFTQLELEFFEDYIVVVEDTAIAHIEDEKEGTFMVWEEAL